MKKSIVLFAAATLLTAGSAFAAPTTTTPEYDGKCAMGITTGKEVKADCSKFSWTDSKTHKTYCFSSEEMKNNWAKNTTDNIAKANEHFTKLAKTHTDSHGSTTTH